jgi:uncharacterized membrane protein required for colicin V production
MIKIHLVDFKVSNDYSQRALFKDVRSTIEAFQNEVSKEFSQKFSRNNISRL